MKRKSIILIFAILVLCLYGASGFCIAVQAEEATVTEDTPVLKAEDGSPILDKGVPIKDKDIKPEPVPEPKPEPISPSEPIYNQPTAEQSTDAGTQQGTATGEEKPDSQTYPVNDPAAGTQESDTPANLWLYVGIGGGVLILAAGVTVAILLSKRRKSFFVIN